MGKNLDFDFGSEFLLYRLRHFSDTCPIARGQSLTVGQFVDQRSVRSAHIKTLDNLMRARFDSDSCVAATLCVRLTNAFTTVPLMASISPPQAQCRKQTGGKGVRGGSAVGQPTSLPIVGRLTSTPAASAQRVCAGHAARSALQMASVRTRRATGD